VQPYAVIKGTISEGCSKPLRINRHVCFTVLGLLLLAVGIAGMVLDPLDNDNDDRGTIAVEVDLDPPFETKCVVPPADRHAVTASAEPVTRPLELFAFVEFSALPSQDSSVPPLAVPLRL
jgi:hypothetical protein